MATREREITAAQAIVGWSHDALGLTYHEIGATLGVSERTLRRWRSGLHLPRRIQRERLEEMGELRYLLSKVYPRPEDQAEWLQSPSHILRGRTPISFLRKGQPGPVRDALATLESGAFL